MSPMSPDSKHRKIMVNIRLNQEEHALVKGKAFSAGLQPAVYIRAAALAKEIKAPIDLETMKAIHGISRVGNLLNQVVKKLHQNGLSESAQEIDSVVEKINNLIP